LHGRRSAERNKHAGADTDDSEAIFVGWLPGVVMFVMPDRKQGGEHALRPAA
jgi:hypothetical protein